MDEKMSEKKNEELNLLLNQFYKLQGLIAEEQNYIKILKGYMENNLDKSDHLNIIWPLVNIIYYLQLSIKEEADKFASHL